MTKANIAKTKIVAEYVDAGKFDVVTFHKDTGRRVATYGGLDLHKAFSESLRRMGSGACFLVLQWPAEMSMGERFEAEKTLATASKYKAQFPLGR